jgi:hypothetical protein
VDIIGGVVIFLDLNLPRLLSVVWRASVELVTLKVLNSLPFLNRIMYLDAGVARAECIMPLTWACRANSKLDMVVIASDVRFGVLKR